MHAAPIQPGQQHLRLQPLPCCLLSLQPYWYKYQTSRSTLATESPPAAAGISAAPLNTVQRLVWLEISPPLSDTTTHRDLLRYMIFFAGYPRFSLSAFKLLPSSCLFHTLCSSASAMPLCCCCCHWCPEHPMAPIVSSPVSHRQQNKCLTIPFSQHCPCAA